jgi:hypothetical protein
MPEDFRARDDIDLMRLDAIERMRVALTSIRFAIETLIEADDLVFGARHAEHEELEMVALDPVAGPTLPDFTDGP